MKSVPLLEIADNVTRGPVAFHGSRLYYATADVDGPNLLAGTPIIYRGRPSRANLVAEPGDILFAKMQATDKIILVNGAVENAIFSTGFFNLRPHRTRLHSRYLFWFLRSPNFQRAKDRRCTGATQKALTLGGLQEIEIPLPDTIEEQKRIATILDKADGVRRKRDKILAMINDFLKSSYLHVVGQRNPHHSDWKPWLVEELAEDRKNSIRSGPFGSALRHGEFVDDGIAVLGIDNAVKNRFAWAGRRFITEEKYEQLRRYKVFPQDIIITIMGTTGRSAVVPEIIPEAITTKHLATITCNTDLIHPEVLSFAIHSDPTVIRQIKTHNKGTTMDGLNLGIIRKLEITRPPMEYQFQFVSILKRTRAILKLLEEPKSNGFELFSSLHQRAFRDEL